MMCRKGPGKRIHRNLIIGKIYKIFVDTFTIFVLLGIVYFLIRRFLVKDSKLEINPPVMLSDNARVGMKKDSFIVGFFILFHVGARFFSASFEIAQHAMCSPCPPLPQMNCLSPIYDDRVFPDRFSL